MERLWGESAAVFKPTEKAGVPREEAESGRVTADGDRRGTGDWSCKVLLGHLWGFLLLPKVRGFRIEELCGLHFKMITGALLGIKFLDKRDYVVFLFTISKKSVFCLIISLKRVSFCMFAVT